MRADTGMIWFSTPRFTAGLVVDAGRVVDAAPTARRWTVGRAVGDIWREGRARGATLKWINPPFGHTVPTGRGTEVVEVAPARCSNAHKLEPWGVKVAYAACGCDKVRPGSRGHSVYYCLRPGCGDVLYGDGHTDDAKLIGGQVRPSLLDLHARKWPAGTKPASRLGVDR